MFKNIYTGNRVLVTGHTGFKGSWLCIWLKEGTARRYGECSKKLTRTWRCRAAITDNTHDVIGDLTYLLVRRI